LVVGSLFLFKFLGTFSSFFTKKTVAALSVEL